MLPVPPHFDPDAVGEVWRVSYEDRALDAEAWAVEQGYREMASDALIDNITSHKAHKASGYIEGDRVVGFRKVLPERA